MRVEATVAVGALVIDELFLLEDLLVYVDKVLSLLVEGGHQTYRLPVTRQMSE